MTSSRRLAVIMFTDIVGYTSVMDQDEEKALQLLETNRRIHQEMLDHFNGQLLKEMGDGMMASFTNIYDSVLCAAAIRRMADQEGFVLRFGIHDGEVIFTDDDVFGDGVNIASRIESIAQAGQILVSESVYRNIHNKPGIHSESFGEQKLKNVSESWHLYSLSIDDQKLDKALAQTPNVDIAEPSEEKRKINRELIRWMLIGFIGTGIGTVLWMNLSSGSGVEGFSSEEIQDLKNKTVSVLPFQGPDNGWLEEFGEMAPYWISRNLTEVTDGKVIDIGSTKKYEDIPKELIKKTGLEVVIEGRYFAMEKEPEDLSLFVDLIELSTHEKRSLGQFRGSSSNPEKILDQATQKVLSIWSLTGRKRWSENPPRFDAFREYSKAEETWYLDYEKSLDHLTKAFELDTTFYEALLMMCTGYGNMGKFEEADSIVNFINSRNPDLDPWTAMRLEFTQERLNGNLEKMAKVYFKMAEFDPRDEKTLHNASYTAYLTGRPGIALYYSDRLLSFLTNPECEPNHINLATRFGAYFALGRYKEILEEVSRLKCLHTNGQMRAYPIKACIRLGRYDLIDTLIGKYQESLEGITINQKDWLMVIVVHELYKMGEMEILKKFATRLLKSEQYNHVGQFFTGDTKAPIEKIKNWVQRDSYNYSAMGHLAFMLANSGDTLSVRDLVKQVEETSDRRFEKGNRKYHLGVLHAQLGNKEKATDLLMEAFEDGYPFHFSNYADDFRLRVLFDHPEFISFVRPRDDGIIE